MTTIVTWLWQGLAIAALTALALRPARHLSAATRYAIWWCALVAVVLLPIVQSLALLSLAPAVQEVGAEPSTSAVIVVPSIAGWAIACAAGIWLATSIAGGLRIAAGLRLLVRLKRQSRPFDGAREKCLTMWSSVRHSGRRPELRVADVACGASALGLGRPTILVSQDFVNGLDDETLDQIVMHEHAHLARFDDWSRLIQAAIAAVAGLHPAVTFICGQIDLEREAACDDLVVSRTGAPRRYAACLADAAEISVGSLDAALIPSAIDSASTLRARVVRLLDPRRHGAPRLAPAVCGAGLLLFAGVVIASRDVRPLVAFLESAPVTAGVAVLDAVAIPSTVRLQEAPVARPSPLPPDPAERAASATVEQTDLKPASPFAIDRAPAIESPDSTAPLDGNRLEDAYDAPAVPDRAPLQNAPGSAAAWNRAADAGLAVGDGARTAGIAIGGFFTRAGKAIAKTF